MPVKPTASRVRRVIHALAFGRGAGELPQRSIAAAAALAKEHQRWWDSRNVVGLGYARKVRHGRLEEPCLQVLVQRKRGRARVQERQRIPERIDAGFLGLRKLWTDVLEVGHFQPERLASETRPAHPGFDVGDLNVSGTLACVVLDAASQNPLGLSCAHVLGSDGAGQPGDPVLCPSGPVAQILGVTNRARIGALTRVGLLSPRDADASANMDAAVFEPDEPGSLSPLIALLGRRPRGVRSQVSLGLPVAKVGAVSGKTTGEIKQIHLLGYLDYDSSSGPVRVPIADLIGISSFTDPGDSGALVLDTNRAAVGMHIGSYEGLSVCIPMQRVLDAMQCSLA